MACGHNNGLALMQFVINAVDGDAAGAVEAGDKSVTAGFMGADLFALVKGKERDA